MGNWLAGAALFVAVLAVPITMWATRQWGTRRARIEVAVRATPLLPGHGVGYLKVTYRDIDVDSPHLVSVSLRNIGPRDLATGTFDAGKPIEIRFDQTFYGLTSRAEDGMKLSAPGIGTTGSQAVVQIWPGLLKRGATWSFNAVTAGPVQVDVEAPLIDTDLQVADADKDDRLDITLRLHVLGIPIEVPIRRGSPRP